MGKTWLRRLIISYLPVFIAVTFVLIFVFFLTMNQLAKKAVMQENMALSVRIMETIEHTLGMLEDIVIRELESTEQLNPFFYASPDSNLFDSLRKPAEKLMDLKVRYPAIDSIYLLRKRDNKILFQDGITDMKRFGDRAFIEDEEALSSVIGQWSGLRTFQKYTYSPQAKTVVSYVRKVPYYSGEQGYIVLNVTAATLQQIVQQMAGSGFSTVYLLDGNESMLASNTAASPGEERIVTKNAYTSTYQSPYTGWTIHSTITNGQVFGFVSTVLYIIAFASLLAVVCGIVWIIFVSRRNYRPIESIMNRIEQALRQRHGKTVVGTEKDELHFIVSAIDAMIEDSNRYLEEYETNRLIRRAHFFREQLMPTRPFEREEWKREMEKLGLQSEYTHLLMAVLEIDHYHAFAESYTRRDQTLFRFILQSVVQEVCQERRIACWCEWTSSSQLGILLIGTEEADRIETSMIQIGEHVRAWVEKHLELTVTIGIGQVVKEAADLPQSYETALEALDYKSTWGNNRLIRYQAIEERGGVHSWQQLQQARQVAQSFRLGEADWEQKLDDFFAALRESGLSKNDLYNLLHYLMFQFEREMMELPEGVRQIWKENAPNPVRLMDRLETIDEMQEDVKRHLKLISDQIQQLHKKNTNSSVMQEVRAFIASNYQDSNLSLKMLGDQFHLSSKYLSQLFKEEFGEKFIDYLTKIRIEKAKKLLRESDRSIQEVAKSVGYNHAFSFIRIFKKIVGVTPRQYRQDGDFRSG